MGWRTSLTFVFAVALGGCTTWSSSGGAEAARILAVEMVGGKSHWNFMTGGLRALTDGGHSVTVFTPFPEGGDRVNYTVVDVSEGFIVVRDVNISILMEMFSDTGGGFVPLVDVAPFATMSRINCDLIYGNGRMRETLRLGRRSGYDAVIVEPFMSHCASHVAHVLRVPLIYITPVPVVGIMKPDYTGHRSNPAVVSNVLAENGVPKTFTQRFVNTVQVVYYSIVKDYMDFKLRYTDPRPYDSSPTVLPSLVFVNSHFALDAPAPVPTDVVNVGGLHLKPPKSLPKDIMEFIEQSPNGVIYFTFGSTVKFSTVPEYIKKAFMEVLAQVPQRVLLKYEDEMENKPKNIMTKKWFPQRDILVHPNVKLFISHGGISGMYEAVDAGVPVLGFPLFGDQKRNVDSLVNTGMAISMDLLSVTKDAFSKNVLELLNNEKYMKNAKTASRIFKDRPLSPAESFVYWTEYVIRHKGAPHLKSHALNLTWYQYYLLDVIGVSIVLISIFIFVTYKVLKSICKYLFRLSRSSKSKPD